MKWHMSVFISGSLQLFYINIYIYILDLIGPLILTDPQNL